MPTMKRLIAYSIFLLALLILCCPMMFAQSTTVSATVVDQSSTTWANGTWKLDLVPNPSAGTQQVNWNGNPLPQAQYHYSGVLDGSGAFSQSVPSTNFIAPSGATYTITVCPNATATCSVIYRQTFQGSTQNISSLITALTPAPQVAPLPLARAYNDAEVSINPSLVGYFYIRVSDNQPRYWGQDGAWHNFITGVTTFQTGNLTPLFTATPSSPTANSISLAYTLQQAAANTIFGNCTGSLGTPSYCMLTLAMLPSGITAAQLGGTTPCGTNNYAQSMTVAGVFGCAQVAFAQLSGNIAVTQMNSGTNADINHYWRGDGLWALTPVLPFLKEESFNDPACSPTTSTDASCTAIATLPSAMPDASYRAQITMISTSGAFLFGVITAKTTTTISYTVTCSFNCGTITGTSADILAIHN
jgi:hypothetical protein